MSKNYISVESNARPGEFLHVFVNQIIWFGQAAGGGTQIHTSDGKGVVVKETPTKVEDLIGKLD